MDKRGGRLSWEYAGSLYFVLVLIKCVALSFKFYILIQN